MADEVVEPSRPKIADTAIEMCEAKSNEHKALAKTFIRMVYALAVILAVGQYWIFNSDAGKVLSENLKKTFSISLFTASVSALGIILYYYKSHISEAAKMDFYKMGFIRTRMAAVNYKTDDGWKSEVRTELTKDAFTYPQHSESKSDKKDVKSINPGHPVSDALAEIMNKVKDIEIKVGAKESK